MEPCDRTVRFTPAPSETETATDGKIGRAKSARLVQKSAHIRDARVAAKLQDGKVTTEDVIPTLAEIVDMDVIDDKDVIAGVELKQQAYPIDIGQNSFLTPLVYKVVDSTYGKGQTFSYNASDYITNKGIRTEEAIADIFDESQTIEWTAAAALESAKSVSQVRVVIEQRPKRTRARSIMAIGMTDDDKKSAMVAHNAAVDRISASLPWFSLTNNAFVAHVNLTVTTHADKYACNGVSEQLKHAISEAYNDASESEKEDFVHHVNVVQRLLPQMDKPKYLYPNPISPTVVPPTTLFDVNPHEISRQFSLLGQLLCRKITPDELITLSKKIRDGGIFNCKDVKFSDIRAELSEYSPKICAAVVFYENLTHAMIGGILDESQLDKRCIIIANTAIDHGDLALCGAVCSALLCAHVSRLTTTWRCIPLSRRTQLHSMVALTNYLNDFAVQRAAVAESSVGIIHPFALVTCLLFSEKQDLSLHLCYAIHTLLLQQRYMQGAEDNEGMTVSEKIITQKDTISWLFSWIRGIDASWSDNESMLYQKSEAIQPYEVWEEIHLQ